MSAAFAFKNVNILTDLSPCGLISGGTVIISDGKIVEISENERDLTGFSGRIIDGRGRYLSAGFIDLHCHGGGGHDFMDATPEAFIGAAELHARYGTTSIFPTSLACSDDELEAFFKVYHDVKDCEYDGAKLEGVHLEGPYFSLEFKGAQPEEYIVQPIEAHYKKIYDMAGGALARWSSAPELEGTEEFAKFLKEHDIVASIAHTSATAAETKEAYRMGFCLATHLYSGMSSIVRKNGFRVAGAVEGAYLCDDMAVELIADGCHLPYELLQLAHKIKGTEHVVLVTDAMRGAGMPDGESVLGSLKNGHKVVVRDGVAFLPDGEAFAGSVCTADRLVREMKKATDLPLFEVVRMITEVPAKIMKMKNKGMVKLNYDADIILFDEDIKVTFTMIDGKIVFEK